MSEETGKLEHLPSLFNPTEDYSSRRNVQMDQRQQRSTAMILTGLFFLLIEECLHCSGEDYRGRLSTTKGGYTCQRWDSQEPHRHNYTPADHPNLHLEENYCRNPNGEPQPWCFTTNSSMRSDNCSTPRCKPDTVQPELSCYTDRGEAYRGNVSVTWSGKTCQRWSAQTPFSLDYTPEKYPCMGLEKNYCRNPNNEMKPWCYTTDPKTPWEFCVVPFCEGSGNNCSEQNLLQNLTRNKDLLTVGRPVRHHKDPVKVSLKLGVYAILDVREIAQTLTLHIWTRMGWMNPYTEWNPDEFCGIQSLNVPAETLWKPDIIITEQIERSKNSPSPYLSIRFYGRVIWLNEEVIVTNCKMHIYKFPFDIQSCSITFRSVTHNDHQLQISTLTDDKYVTWLSEMSIRTQYEWLFVDMKISKKNVQFPMNQTLPVFTINMKRRAALYIANFLMPILFFLSLDLASFLISDTGGEKLSFKITVLLAVTVMQLLLNDILPGSSDKIPLIAIFCVGIFTLMLLSVLETILVMNLIDRDASSQEKETEQSMKKKRDVKPMLNANQTEMFSLSSSTHDNTAGKSAFVINKFFRDQQTEESINLKMILDELEDIRNTQKLLSDTKEGDWTKMAKRINTVFMLFYFPAVIVLLVVLFSLWTSDD